MSEIAQLLAEIAALRDEVRALRDHVAPSLPAELTLAQAMQVTNHTCTRTFHKWCKRRRVRPISRGRYSLRRLQAALAR